MCFDLSSSLINRNENITTCIKHSQLSFVRGYVSYTRPLCTSGGAKLSASSVSEVHPAFLLSTKFTYATARYITKYKRQFGLYAGNYNFSPIRLYRQMESPPPRIPNRTLIPIPLGTILTHSNFNSLCICKSF